MINIVIRKKDGSIQSYNPNKIKTAIGKSAQRAMYELTDEEKDSVVAYVETQIKSDGVSEVPIMMMHSMVEAALEKVAPEVAKSYRDYRDYKVDFVAMLDEVYKKSQSIMYIGDKENANTDSALVATKRSLVFNAFNKELYKKFFMTRDEIQACNDGYIYVHDMSARRDTMNCCLFNIKDVLSGGFEMGNVWYNEPKTLDTAFDVIGDVVLAAASQQYGGFTIPEVDKVLAKYARMTHKKQKEKYLRLKLSESDADAQAWADTEEEMRQGYQGWEYKFNTVGSSRGDYPFITITFGLGTDRYEKLATRTILRVHKAGQGRKDRKIPVLFPKLVFVYTKELHGAGMVNEDLFEEAIACSAKTMYPDYLSLDGDNHVGDMWRKYGKVISPMGCRAFLSPWYERGGMSPADENDTPVFEGRFNIGAVSLHLPMILARARREGRDFYEILDHYLEMIRQLHIRTYAYLGEMRASTNPLAYCEGGFYGGHLQPGDKIKPLLKSATASFGITALNELQELYNGKSIVEDGEFALEALKHINEKVREYKEKDGNLYAIYGTPAENLCFSGDTLIQTYTGDKPISEIKPGDLVYSFNEELHKIELKKVLESKKTNDHAVVCKVSFDNGQQIICTPNHPFAVIDYDSAVQSIKWIYANELKSGMEIESNSVTRRNNHKVISVEILQDLIPVYNIEVEDNHNYYAGGTNGVLVHNCGLQVTQFRKLYGIIESVSDRPYVSNSFHCHVTEDISPIRKQDLEHRFWNLCAGGRIQYVRYPIGYNMDAIRSLVRRAMEMGFYEGVNLALAYCNDCGHQELEMDTCPVCGSRNLTKIDRMNGYLAYSRVKGASRLNDAKMAEIAERKSM